MYKLAEVAVPTVVVIEVGFSVDHLTGAETFTVKRWLNVKPAASVTVTVSRYVPLATSGETTNATPFAVDVSIENPVRGGDIEKVLAPNPSAAVKVSLRPPVPEASSSVCEVGYVAKGVRFTPYVCER
jgi:aspartate carbamoyltransferase regulatory subunit